MNYVLYHSNCYDGFGAAYAAWKKLGDTGTKYIPVSYGFPLPEMPGAENIYIVDFSYPEKTIVDLSHKAQVFVLDHHKTAAEMLGNLARETEQQGYGNPYVVFNMEKSGALLTWEYFHGKEPAPLLIQHISDRDLWKFAMDGSAKVHKALVSYPMDFGVWDKLDVEQLKAEGVTCERLYTSLVNNIVSHAWIGTLDGKKVPMVNTSIAWSEVGAALLEKFNNDPGEQAAIKAGNEIGLNMPAVPYPVVASFTVEKNSVMWSLRSHPDYDCSEIAKKFGGGGHKNAAGFKTARY